jgi:large subunit ribosomal protein L25
VAKRTVIIKEIQHHPFKDEIVHVDFSQIALDELIKVKVAIAAKGEAIGVVKNAGILERIMWEVEIECLPTQIPEKIEIDVADLEVGHTKTVKDLIVPSGIKVLADPEQIVVSVAAKKAVEEVVAAPEAEAVEPEVIREKKPEEEVAAEGQEAPSQAEKKPAQEKKPAKEEKK